VQRWVPGRFVSLGTDGYGRSDARKALRKHFEVDKRYIAVTALKALADDGVLDQETVANAIEKYGIDPDRPDPVTL
jgi:pyruvate dehydrogenase E1 component